MKSARPRNDLANVFCLKANVSVLPYTYPPIMLILNKRPDIFAFNSDTAQPAGRDVSLTSQHKLSET